MPFAFQMTGPGAENIKCVETPDREPGIGEIKIKISASSMNFHDLVTISGLIPSVQYPCVPMSDGCGEIVAIGQEVTNFSVGDRVLPQFYPHWLKGNPSPEKKRDILGETMDGCLQEYLILPASSAVKAPNHLTDTEAATLVCAGLTAWYPLMETNNLSDQHTVLLQGTGGVSLAALKIAKAVGAKVVITSSSDEKLERCKAMGADWLINYRTSENWEEEVLAQTGGVDITLDTGGPNTLGRSIRCTKDSGHIAVIGILSGFEAAEVSILDVMQKNLRIEGVTVGCRESFDRLCRFTEKHEITPVISHTLEAQEIAAAIDLMAAGNHFGKIAINVGSG